MVRGATGGMLIGPLSAEDRASISALGPGPGFVLEPLFSELPVNPVPQEGLDYWLWVLRDAGGSPEWLAAKWQGGMWWPTWRRGGLLGGAVRFWRGPLSTPEAPTPAQVALALVD